MLLSRKEFLKWAGLGSAGLVTAVVDYEIVKEQASTSISGGGLDSFTFETVTVDQQGKIVRRASNQQATVFKEDLGHGINLEMVYIPGGTFMMGSPEAAKYDTERPQHEVTLQPFFMGKFLVTQEQWQEIASLPIIERNLKPDPSYFKGNNLPVEQVSWEEATEFCQRLSKQTAEEYRLPTEAEWEYACRAGTNTLYNFGENITDKLANYGENLGKTNSVGEFLPNAFGLNDMHGNVWEWCQDDWHNNYQDAPTDGSVWLSGKNSSKVRRGGSWYDYPASSAHRIHTRRDDYGFIGFRVVCGAPMRWMEKHFQQFSFNDPVDYISHG